MPDVVRPLTVYLHLARASELRRQPLVTVKLLVLAGAAAEEAGLSDIAGRCHAAVLSRNPQHLLRHWQTFSIAFTADRFQIHLRLLRRQYSPERAEHMLGSLGIELARERDLYADDHEYATALVDAVVRH